MMGTLTGTIGTTVTIQDVELTRISPDTRMTVEQYNQMRVNK